MRVYDPTLLLGVSAAVVSAGLLLPLTYDLPVVRYILVGIVFILLIIFRKKVIDYVKKLMALRKEGKAED